MPMNWVGSGWTQVEVRQRHDQRGDHRAGGEQQEADEPRADEDVAPDAPRGLDGRSQRPRAAGSAGRRGQRLGRLGHGAVRLRWWWGGGWYGEGTASRAGGSTRPGGAGGGRSCTAPRRRCPGGWSSACRARRRCRRPAVVRYLFWNACQRRLGLGVVRHPGLVVGHVRVAEHGLRHGPVELDVRELLVDGVDERPAAGPDRPARRRRRRAAHGESTIAVRAVNASSGCLVVLRMLKVSAWSLAVVTPLYDGATARRSREDRLGRRGRG